MWNESLISAFNDLIFFSGFKQFDLDALSSASHHGSCSWVLLGFFVLQVYHFYTPWNFFQPLSFQRFSPRPTPVLYSLVGCLNLRFCWILSLFHLVWFLFLCLSIQKSFSGVSLPASSPGSALASLIHVERDCELCGCTKFLSLLQLLNCTVCFILCLYIFVCVFAHMCAHVCVFVCMHAILFMCLWKPERNLSFHSLGVSSWSAACPLS